MGEVVEVNGPIVTIDEPGIRNGDQVRIGRMGLIGEVIHIRENDALVQVYESTESLHPGEQVTGLGHPLSVELGPGLLGQIFDGVQRPLDKIMALSGDHISRGLDISALDRDRTWHYVPRVDLVVGNVLRGGEVLGTVKETATIEHRILAPPHCAGEIIEHAPEGDYSIDEVIVRLRTESGAIDGLKMFHHWPVRLPRPYRSRANSGLPLITGQRILDTFFPMLKGGKAAVPGPFGAGKTIVQQQIARWSNADIVLYVGCGERGNELVEILQTFPRLSDPNSGRSLMERTFLVANTSNMPESLREVAGRLGQMPVEEGYPAYLASRLSAFYERAGTVNTLSGVHGSVSLIGAVSPPGGDFSEPVTSHTKEIIRTFWALSKPLADARHYPAISWLESFTDYTDRAARWWSENVNQQWAGRRQQALAVLTEADELERIVNLVGPEALSAAQRWVLESAGLIKEAVLQQSALDEIDSYCSPQKQFQLLDLVLQYHQGGTELIDLGVPIEELTALPFGAQLKRLKSTVDNADLSPLEEFAQTIRQSFDATRAEYGSQRGTAS
jgi:V/A-type H+-transporting ATPase subunit A